jgi:hypothetical protein
MYNLYKLLNKSYNLLLIPYNIAKKIKICICKCNTINNSDDEKTIPWKPTFIMWLNSIIQKMIFPVISSSNIWGPRRIDELRERAMRAVTLRIICPCGKLQLKAEGGARHIFTCHCTICAKHTKSEGGKAPTWTAVCRNLVTYFGKMRIYSASSISQRGVCAYCGHCIYMDYFAKNTIYIANALPHTQITGDEKKKFIADCDIFWKNRKSDAQPTAPIQFDKMPLAAMGFIPDSGNPNILMSFWYRI